MKIPNKILTAFIIWFVFNHMPLEATDQEQDAVYINGKIFYAIESPLLPIIHSLNLQLKADSTANWKGYTASWEIKEGHLFMRELALGKNKLPPSLEPYASSASSESPATWYSGYLKLPQGELIGYDSKFEPIFSKTLQFEIKKGKVLSKKLVYTEITVRAEEQ